MRYCLVENGTIVRGPIHLPKTWNNISNFNVLDNQTLISYGWLPHTFIETATPGQIIEGSNFEIRADSVIETQVARNPTEQEQQKRLDEKWQRFRVLRNYALSICDWTQLADNTLTAEKKSEWASYRQQLRDLPSSFGDPDLVVFPPDPDGNVFDPSTIPPFFLM